jgi:hypothetical protein
MSDFNDIYKTISVIIHFLKNILIMKESVSKIWQKIQTFSLDNPTAALTFSQKLAKEQKWTPSFTHRAIAEYKKFMLLCATCPNGASPSETVDKVWHLHLTFTTNYWVDFCQKTLGKEIHHHPSQGGSVENQKHQDWYEETFKHYVAYFDEPPPQDIWTYPIGFAFETYLSSDSVYKNVPIQVVAPYELSVKDKNILYAYFAVIALFIVFLGNPFALNGPNFLSFYMIFAFATILPISIHFSAHEKAYEKTKSLLPEGLHLYHLAHLSGKQRRMFETIIIELTDNGLLSVNEQTQKFNIHRILTTPALERNPLYHTVMALDGNTTDGKTLLEIFNQLVYRLLQSAPLSNLDFKSNSIVNQAQWLWYYIGVIRFVQGVVMGKNVGILGISIFIYLVCDLILYGSMHYNYSIADLIIEKYQLKSMRNAYTYALADKSTLTHFAAGNVGLMLALSILPQERMSDGSGGSDSGDSSGDGGGDSGCGGCGGD